MYQRSTSYLLILFFSISALHSQVDNLNYFFRHVTVEDGLAHTDLTSVAQDSSGFIWFGTFGGLQRYDGTNLETFWNDESNLKAIYNNRIRSLSINGQDLIWIASEGGVKCFNAQRNKYVDVIAEAAELQTILSTECLKIMAVGDSVVYIINTTGLYRIDVVDGRVKSYVSLLDSDLSRNYTSDIYAFEDGLFAALNHQLIYVPWDNASERGGGRSIGILDQENQKTLIESVVLDDKYFYFGSWGSIVKVERQSLKGVNSITGKRYELSNPLDMDLSGESIYDMDIDASGNLWMASEVGLIEGKFSDSDFQGRVFSHVEFVRNSLGADHVSSIFLDRNNNLWIGTYSAGGSYIDLSQKQFSLLRRDPSNPKNTLSQSFVRAIAMDEKGKLWLGTRSSGISIYDFSSGNYEQINSDNSRLSSNNIRSLNLDNEGRMWIGTDNGLNVLEGDRIFKINDRNFARSKLSGNNFFSMDVDVFGNVWVGSWDYGGLNIVNYTNRNNYQIENIGTKDGLSSNRISFIYADTNKPEVFVATNQGLNHFILNENGEIEKNFRYMGYENDTTSLNSNFVWPIVRESDSVLWVGTLGGGLNKVTIKGDGKYSAESFGSGEGFPSNDIESILLDDEGDLWVGSHGITNFDKDTYEATLYDYNDGLQGNSFKIGSSFKSKDGQLFFGGTNGVTFFDPAEIRNFKRDISVAFTDFYVNGESISPNSENKNHILDRSINATDEVTLNHRQNNFTIFFSSLDFKGLGKYKYRYKLNGHDSDWIYIDANGGKLANYSNLDYGNYSFQVQSSSDESWDGNIAELRITLQPPFWSTNFAKFILALIFMGFIFLAFLAFRRWYRLKQNLKLTLLEEKKMEEMHQLRSKFFTNISHEFKTPLTLIISPIERLMSETLSEIDRQKVYAVIHNNANRLLSLINELMDFRKVETKAYKLKVAKLPIQDILEDIVSGFDQMAQVKNLKFSYKIKLEEVQDIWVDKGVVEKIVLNLISNAFRYTKEGSIKIEAGTSKTLLETNLANEFVVGDYDSSKKYVFIKVSDTGKGITKASIENIFDRYYRIEDKGGKHLGSGVGLALVKSLAILHKGEVIVHSERNVGSEFIICLARGKEIYAGNEVIEPDQVQDLVHIITEEKLIDDSIDEEEKEQEVDSSLTKILVVEDNLELLSFLKDAFSESYFVLEAHNGEEALEKVHEHRPELIISDIMMPIMDGIQFCQTIKSDINYSHIPLILLSAKSGDETKIEGTDVGADAYFSKPFNLTLLTKTVANMLDSRKAIKERYRNDTFLEEREMVSSRKDQEFMDRLIEIIEEKMSDPAFDIDHLCMEIGNSRTKLYNKIKGLTGLSVGEFIRRLRMKKSAEILLKEDLSVSEVMIRVGIQSQSYFTKTFKKEFGVTPAQYSTSQLKQSEEEA